MFRGTARVGDGGTGLYYYGEMVVYSMAVEPYSIKMKQPGVPSVRDVVGRAANCGYPIFDVQ